MVFGFEIWKNKETYDYHRNYNGVGNEPEEPIYANTFKGEWFAKKMDGRDRVETDTSAVCMAASQAYGDYKKETNREEKAEIKRFADEMYGVYFTHAEWYNIPRDAFIVIYKIKD